MGEFRMPALGADMETGTVVEWLVGPGDTVRRGDVVAVVDTEKSAIDVECFESGVIERLLVAPGASVPVGAPLAIIASDAAAASPTIPRTTPAAAPPSTPAPAPAPAPTPASAPAPPPAPTPGRVRSPLVRLEATRAGLDLAGVPGTGPDGSITRADVRRAAHPHPQITPYARRLARERGLDPVVLVAAGSDGVVRARDLPSAPTAPAQPAPTSSTPAGSAPSTRHATAALMARASREIPHYYLSTEIELTATLDWLKARNRELPVAARLLPAAALLRATVLALQAVPQLNGHWRNDAFVPGGGVHLGVAVSLRGGGLAAPVIRDAHAMGIEALMARLGEVGSRARAGRLRSSEASGATATVTNLGELGVDSVAGVIHPPQVALIGFGTIRPRPWAVGPEVLVRPVLTATLAADHRATDGAVGARLLHDIDRRLHRPEELL